MPLVPEEPERPPTPVERVSRVIIAPVADHRAVIALAVAAGAGSFAADPFGPLVAALLVVVAWDAGRRK